MPGITPNVPVVDSSGFRCEPLPGVADFEPVDELDMRFGDWWNAVDPQPEE